MYRVLGADSAKDCKRMIFDFRADVRAFFQLGSLVPKLSVPPQTLSTHDGSSKLKVRAAKSRMMEYQVENKMPMDMQIGIMQG